MTSARSIGLSNLEPRMLLAGDVTASVVGNTLNIEGDDDNNRIVVEAKRQLLKSDLTRVVGGRTSVSLDAALLADAASLDLSSANGTAVPASGFDVAFRIIRDTSFSVDLAGGLGTADGTIEHRGTVGFNNDSVVVGNFSIGFDPQRAAGDASGYFVEDTVAGLGVLFDVSVPGEVDVQGRVLTLGDADLLVSPEFGDFLVDNGLSASNLTGADVGDAQIDARITQEALRRVNGGATSVDLDFGLLSTAANLDLTAADGTAPAAPGFAVAFEIDRDSSFIYDRTGGFAPVSGMIGHTGSVTFNEAITVGDFSIGFDPARVVGDASGFFVADTLSLNIPLFDVAAPDSVDAGRRGLDIGPADLLVSPEFADVLADPAFAGADLTGAAVGSALIDADARRAFVNSVHVRGASGTTINNADSASFHLGDVGNIDANLGAGHDRVDVRNIRADSINLELGTGNDAVNFRSVQADAASVDLGEDNDHLVVTVGQLGSLDVAAGSGHDTVALFLAQVNGNANIDLGTGADNLFVLASRIDGDANFTGGEDSDHDRFINFASHYGSLTASDL